MEYLPADVSLPERVELCIFGYVEVDVVVDVDVTPDASGLEYLRVAMQLLEKIGLQHFLHSLPLQLQSCTFHYMKGVKWLLCIIPSKGQRLLPSFASRPKGFLLLLFTIEGVRSSQQILAD
jgi:hypothetical protein